MGTGKRDSAVSKQQTEMLNRMTELPLERQRDLVSLAGTNVLTCNMDIEPWERELVEELRRDENFTEKVRGLW